LTYTDFQQVCERWQAHADPDGWHGDHDLAVDNRHVHLARLGQGHVLHAEGDALTGDVMAKILARYTDTEFDHDRQHGGVASRTGRQRRYDALVRIFAAADTHQPPSRREAPLVNIICTETAAIDALTTVFDPRLAWSETDHGTPVDRHDLALALLTGAVRRVMVDPVGRPVALGRRSRQFRGAAREAVQLLGGGICDQPGCNDTYGLQIDHLAAWYGQHGPTDSTNGGNKCGHHNRTKHTNNTTVTRDHTGWHHHRQDGTEICPRDGPADT